MAGTLAGVGSSVFVSLNGIYTKEALPFVNKNDWALSFDVNAMSSIIFVPIILLTETDVLAGYASRFTSPTFWCVAHACARTCACAWASPFPVVC